MAVFLTGDIHGSMEILKLDSDLLYSRRLTRDDYVIVLGDFGLPWRNPESEADSLWLDWLEERPWTTLFIDGNHENFNALDTYPICNWHGGSVRTLRNHVMHLRRAEVFEIEGATFFAMGGAHSVDKAFRTPFESWWPQEVPARKLRQEAEALVGEIGAVDYVLTHCPPTLELIELSLYEDFDCWPDDYNNWLQTAIADKLRFKQWFYGHMHIDAPWRRPYTPLYDTIYELGGIWSTFDGKNPIPAS